MSVYESKLQALSCDLIRTDRLLNNSRYIWVGGHARNTSRIQLAEIKNTYTTRFRRHKTLTADFTTPGVRILYFRHPSPTV